MTTLRPRLVYSVVFAVVVVAGCGGEGDTSGNDDPSSFLPFLIPTREPPEGEEDRGSVVLAGRLVPEAAKIITDSIGSGPIMLLVIASSDCFTCEDLGRQLREVVRLAPRESRVVVATNADGLRRTREFLRRERVTPALMLGFESFSLLDGAVDAIPTPAVLIGQSATDSVGGVAHPVQTANVRSISFAEELGLGPG